MANTTIKDTSITAEADKPNTRAADAIIALAEAWKHQAIAVQALALELNTKPGWIGTGIQVNPEHPPKA